MNTTRFKIRTVLTLALASGWFAAAQSTNVPGPSDYERFTQFITQRNIFDPNRYAVATGQRPRFQRQTPRYAPSFTLVGTMSYGKGMFAFFDGNQPELRKVLYPSDSNGIAGYVLAEISATNVILQSADKKQTVNLTIGKGMRQEGSQWIPSDQGEVTYSGGMSRTPAPSADSSSTEAGSASAPSAALQGNDVLKKLMQQREQELK